MVESFDLTVSDASEYADLKAADFAITGNYDDDAFMDDNRLYGSLKHWSWVPVFNDKEMTDWLFEQKKGDTAPILLQI